MTKEINGWKRQPVRRLSAVPHLYGAICREIRRHQKRRKWAAWQLEDAAGLQDGYLPKLMSPASPTGRLAGYDTVDLALTAVAGRGYRVLVVPADFDATDPAAVAALLDEQDATEAERVARIIDFAANTNHRPHYDV